MPIFIPHTTRIGLVLAMMTLAGVSSALSHGDVAPQPVNTAALPDLGEEWATENPYRGTDRSVWWTAVEIGASGYNQNCARCHGLGAVSGGLAPDLRFLEADDYGDEWYTERFRNGYTQNGITKMPAFGDLLGQKAAWAIRTYIETRPDEESIEPHVERLKEIRNILNAQGDQPNPDTLAALRRDLIDIAGRITTGSGAPKADSMAAVAARQLAQDVDDGTAVKRAAETLTVGLSVAQ